MQTYSLVIEFGYETIQQTIKMLGSLQESGYALNDKHKIIQGRPIKVTINPKVGKKVFERNYYYFSFHSKDCFKVKFECKEPINKYTRSI